MAGRDFVAKFLTNFDRFRTDSAEGDLDSLGNAADDAQTDIDRLGTAASGAQSDVDTLGSSLRGAAGDASRADGDLDQARRSVGDLGDGADRSAREIDDAFDRIRTASRGVGDDLDTAARDADGAFNDISGEAASTGQEMAASFDGSADSVTDAFQELAANAAASFGPIGVAAGIAGALLIGNARANAEELTAITDAMSEALRSVEDGSTTAAEASFDFLNSLEADQYTRVKEEAEKYGIALGDLGLAAAGNADAIDRNSEAIARTREEMGLLGSVQETGAINQAAWNEKITDFIPGAEGFKGLLDELTGASTLASDAAGANAEAERQRAIDLAASKVAAEQAAISTEAYASVTDAATEVAGKAWDEGADGIISSISEVNAYLTDAVEAQEAYAANVIAVQERIGTEGVAALQSIPGDQAAIFASARNATDAELATTVSLSRRRGAETSGALADGVRSGGGGVFDAAVDVAGRVGGGGSFGVAGYNAGQDAGRNVASGIRSQQGSVESAAASLRSAAVRNLASVTLNVTQQINTVRNWF